MGRKPKQTVPLTEEQQSLVTKNRGLFYKRINKYRNAITDIDFEDLEGQCLEDLCRAAQTFDQDRAKFSTHASWKTTGAISVANRKRNRRVEKFPLVLIMSRNIDTSPADYRTSETEILNHTKDINMVLEKVKKQISEKDYNILLWRAQGLKLQEIGEKVGLSKNRVAQRIEEAQKKIYIRMRSMRKQIQEVLS